MPSPIGHLLAGVGVAWTVDAMNHRAASRRLVLTCGALAALPDADLVVPRSHRTATHSVTAVLVVFIVAAVVSGKVTRWRTVGACTAAYASHLLLDWLGVDRFPPRGIQLLWPFSDAWYISDWNVFRQTARQHPFTWALVRVNVLAVAQELAILLPVLYLLWLVRVKALSRLATQVSGRHHPPQ